MGGVIFILSSIITMALTIRRPGDEAMVALYAFIAFGIIGALDDGLKIIHKNNLGLRAYQKMLLILVVSGIFGYYSANNPNIGTSIIMPFTRKSLDLGAFIYQV